MTKEGMDWLIRPFMSFTVVLFRCCERITKEILKISQLKKMSRFL